MRAIDLMGVLALAAGVSLVASGGTVEVVASKDNTLYQSTSGHLSNGSGDSLFCGKTAMGGDRRAVVAFDLTGVVPADERVVSATLQLNLAQTIVGSVPVSAHRLLADWGEGASNAMQGNGGGGTAAQPGDATWLHTFFPGQFWAIPGGDFDATPSATMMIGGLGFHQWSSDGLAADVNAWLDDPSSNFGWVLVNESGGSPSAKRFWSRESDDFLAPRLILETEAIGEPCPTDLDGSGTTDSVDLNVVLSAFGCVGGGCAGDVDGDGDTDSADLNEVLAAFGAACP